MLAPEERDGVKAFARREHVARRRPTLALGDNPMLDADTGAGQPVRPARDVARGIDAGPARVQVLVDPSWTKVQQKRSTCNPT